MYIVTYVFMIFTYLRSYISQNFVVIVWVGCACVIIIIIVFIQNLNNRRQQQTGQTESQPENSLKIQLLLQGK